MYLFIYLSILIIFYFYLFIFFLGGGVGGLRFVYFIDSVNASTSGKFGTLSKFKGTLDNCCEPLQKLRVRLGACKTGLSHPGNFILLIIP